MWGAARGDPASPRSARRGTRGERRPGPSSAPHPWLPRPSLTLHSRPARTAPQPRPQRSPREPRPRGFGAAPQRGSPSSAATLRPRPGAWHEAGPGPALSAAAGPPARGSLGRHPPAPAPHRPAESRKPPPPATCRGGRPRAEGTHRNWAPRRRGSNCIRGPPRPRRPGGAAPPAGTGSRWTAACAGLCSQSLGGRGEKRWKTFGNK